MTEKVANKKTLYATWFNSGLLVFVAGLILSNFANIKEVESKALDTVNYKVRLQDHVDNLTFSEMESYDLVNHAKDTIVHMTELERKTYNTRMARTDSVLDVFLKEQYWQGLRLKRIESKINKLKD